MPDPAAFRAQFPVLARHAYFNAGTEGPVPAASADAVAERVARDTADGRIGRAYFDTVMELADRARTGYAEVLGARPEHVALTGSTTDGINTILGGLHLRQGEEVLTSDEEHPGLLAPLRRARLRHGIRVRVVAFEDLAHEIREDTRLVACSHVSWVGGKVVDVAGLVASGVPILLDAAQGIGAIPLDLPALGVDFYAASGQKWMCGPEGSGCLYVRPDRLDELEPPWPGYSTLAEAKRALESDLAEGAKRLDLGFPSAVRSTWTTAAMDVFRAAGWDWVHERAATLAQSLADALALRGLAVAPRGRSTLVSWSAEDPDAEVARLGEAGFLVRSIAIGGLVRASVGAWSDEGEVEALADAAAASV